MHPISPGVTFNTHPLLNLTWTLSMSFVKRFMKKGLIVEMQK